MWQRWYPDSPFQDCTLVLTESDVHNILHAFIFQLGVVFLVLSCFSCVQLFATPWTAATPHPTPPPCPAPTQAPLSMGFSRQDYWSELPCPSPGDLPDTGIEPISLVSPCTGKFFTTSTTWRAQCFLVKLYLWASVEDIKAHICEILFKLGWKTTS